MDTKFPRPGLSWYTLFLATCFIFTLLLAACGGDSPVRSNPPVGSASGGITPAATAPGSAPTDGSGSPTPTSTPASAPAPGTTPRPGVFGVSGVSTSVSPSSFSSSTCGSTSVFTFTGTIRVPAGTGGGTVSYTWLSSDGGIGSIHSIPFAAGQTSKIVTDTWVLGTKWGDGSTFWMALKTISPNSMTSSHANFRFTCTRRLSSASAVVSPVSYTCSATQVTFTFTATVHISGGPGSAKFGYRWARSDGATSSSSVYIAAEDQTSVTFSNTWTLYSGVPNGTYWEQLVVTSADIGSVTSNRANFTINCLH